MEILEILKLNWEYHNKILVSPEDEHLLKNYSWYIDEKGYARCTGVIQGVRNAKLHRVITEFKFERVDHIDRNKRNNRRDNLRYLTNSQNCLNSPRIKQTPMRSALYKCVYKEGKRSWYATLNLNYSKIRILTCFNEHECAYAYNYAIRILKVEHAYLNQNIPAISPARCLEIEANVSRKLVEFKLLT